MMKTTTRLLIGALFSMLLQANVAQAIPAFSSPTHLALLSTTTEGAKPKKPKKSKAKKGGGVTFYEGSAESRAERDKRLMRECKGRTNAGVCEGYTR
jgi:hypothetical protein